MRTIFVCANCGKEIEKDQVYMCLDNFLITHYFENNRLNRFCSRDCFCESLMLDQVYNEDIPLDAGETAADDAEESTEEETS